MPDIGQILDDFDYLSDWEDRYRYVIELGRELPSLPDQLRTDTNKVRGCASQVWLASHAESGATEGSKVMAFEGDSDAHIVRGLIAILFAIYSGHTPEDIVALDSRALFRRIGLEDHLTAQRSNGLAAMVERIKTDARTRLENPATA